MSLLNHIRAGRQSASSDLSRVEPAVPDASGMPMEERIKLLFDRNVRAATISDVLQGALKASESGWRAGALLSGPRELEG